MKTIPGLDIADLKMSLPLPTLALLLGLVALRSALASNPKRKPWAWAAAAVCVLTLLTLGIVVGTYFDMRHPR